MPKIIKDVEKKILNVSKKLFYENDYEEVDMRKIAKEVGIAVGTLYNYYPNKKQILISAFVSEWENNFMKLNNIIGSDKPIKQKIKCYINTFYDGIIEVRGLGKKLFFQMTMKSENHKKDICAVHEQYFQNIRISIFKSITLLLKEWYEQNEIEIDENFLKRKTLSFVSTIFAMSHTYSNEREENLKFLYDSIIEN